MFQLKRAIYGLFWPPSAGLILLLFIFTSSWGNTAAPANSMISNAASATYTDEDGTPFSSISNTFEIVVQQVFAIRIAPDGTTESPGQTIIAFTGQEVLIPYTLTNPGNGSDTYTLSTENNELANIRIVIDVNRDGALDESDQDYDNNLPEEIGPSETLNLLITGTVAADQDPTRIFFNLDGSSVGDPAKNDSENVAAIDVTADGFLTIQKAANSQSLEPGQSVEFRISINNPGSLPVLSAEITDTDFDNDGEGEVRTGILIADTIPAGMMYATGTATGTPESGFAVYAGDNNLWKLEEAQADPIAKVGFFIPGDLNAETMGPGESGELVFTVTVNGNASPGPVSNQAEVRFNNRTGLNELPSNRVQIEILPVIRLVADDIDDNGAATGDGTVNDPDDVTLINQARPGTVVEFRNEIWNLGNIGGVIGIVTDLDLSQNLPDGVEINFKTENGEDLPDTNNDGISDTGMLGPGERFPFITQFSIPLGVEAELVTIAIRGIADGNTGITDPTFNIISSISSEDVTTDNVRIQASILVGNAIVEQPLSRERIRAHEFNEAGEQTRSRIFLTSEDGSILFTEDGELFPLTDWMRDGFSYRITLAGEFNEFTYFLTPSFFKSDFEAVTEPGETFTRGDITVTVAADRSRTLQLPLDPAGFVFDAVTGERINSACATFYRCNDQNCNSFTPVDPARLDLFPNGATRQDNPQVTGPSRGGALNVGTGPGAFQFQFAVFQPTDVGFYFIGIDFDCGTTGSNPDLANTYQPVALQTGSLWDPLSGDTYRGQPFFVDTDFPQASLLRIPLVPGDLGIEKTVNPSTASIGDLLQFTITVENNSDLPVFNASVVDDLPAVLRYRDGTTRINDVRANDPQISANGRQLTWTLPNLDPDLPVTIKFYAVITGSAQNNRQFSNIAHADGFLDVNNTVSLPRRTANASFKVIEGVFTDRAYIVGKVFVDDNDNQIQDHNEQGLEGIKIYTEFGRYVVTDSEGKYHFDNVKPGSHILKLDSTTLPPYSTPSLLTNRHFEDGQAMCVDVFPGDLFKANFGLLPNEPLEATESWHKSSSGYRHL